MSESSYAKRRIIVPPFVWTDVVAPFNCNYFGMRHIGASDGNIAHAGDIKIITGTDDTQFDLLASGSVDSVIVSYGKLGALQRFASGATIFQVQSSNAYDQVVVVTWVQ